MALLTSDVVLDEAMDRYELNTVIMKMADGRFDPAWRESPTKGDHITIPLPIYARGRRGEQADPQTIDERPAVLRIPAAFGSDSLLTDRQLSMELTDFKRQVLEPHIDRISSDVSTEACKEMVMQVSNFVGTPGVVPTTLTTYNDAHRLLTQGGAPTGIGNRAMLADAAMIQKAVEAGYQFFNSQVELGEQYKSGNMGVQGGAMWNMEQALYQHTIGNLGGTPRVDGAGQQGNVLNTKGWTASVNKVLRRGDKLWLAGCYMVHPTHGKVYGDLKALTVAADVDSDGAGKAAVPLTEAIEFGTPYANVSALAADSALISVWGQAAAGQGAIAGTNVTLGILMHRSALLYASPNLELPKDVDELSGVTRSKRMKIGMRIWRASDVKSGERITRLDMLCGFLVAQPNMACLVCSL